MKQNKYPNLATVAEIELRESSNYESEFQVNGWCVTTTQKDETILEWTIFLNSYSPSPIILSLVGDETGLIETLTVYPKKDSNELTGRFKTPVPCGDYHIHLEQCTLADGGLLSVQRYKSVSIEGKPYPYRIETAFTLIHKNPDLFPNIGQCFIYARRGALQRAYLKLEFNTPLSEEAIFYAYCYDSAGRIIASYDDDDEYYESFIIPRRRNISTKDVELTLHPKRMFSPGKYFIVLYYNCTAVANIEFEIEDSNSVNFHRGDVSLIKDEMFKSPSPQASNDTLSPTFDDYLCKLAEFFSKWSHLYPINIDSHTVYEEKRLFETKSYYQSSMLPVLTLGASTKIYTILKSAFDNGQLSGIEDLHKSLNKFISFFVKPDYEFRPGLTIDADQIFESILFLR